ncbi:hypothetical protein ACFO6V_17805 [Promicromonospora alba]|uniref:Uncharacterized protein n=1 Tax=Promicromonospora alba TaxID=1616110 RepID=A0ABV9HKN4_9MICO
MVTLNSFGTSASADIGGTIGRAHALTARLLADIGMSRIELVTFTSDRICLHPVDLTESEQIARGFGCDFPLDHRMFVPGHTLWTGIVDGLEVQIRSAPRQHAGVPR